MQNNEVSRALDPGEAFFYMADLVSSMNFVLFAERSAHLEPARIRVALSILQRENVLLKSRIVWDETQGLCFAPAPDAEIELVCRTVEADAWQHIIGSEPSHPFAPGVAPLVRCLYLQIDSPPRSVLALCFHHSVADGRSGGELLRRLLECIATGIPLSAARPQAAQLPPMYQAFPPRFRWAEQEELAEQLMDAMMSDYTRHGTVGRQPYLQSRSPTRNPRFIRLHFPPDFTHSLLKLCRSQGTSVHGALCAAQLLAQYSLHEDGQPTNLFLSCPVDMRAHLEPVQPTTPTGLYVTLVSAVFSIDQSTDFWDLARQIIVQTRRQLARGEGHLFFSTYGLEDQPVLPQRLERFKKRLLANWQNTMVSNIGSVATVESDPAVEAISFALCPMPYQTVFSAVSTYRDQMILNITYDEGKLSCETVTRLTDAMRAQLLAAVA